MINYQIISLLNVCDNINVLIDDLLILNGFRGLYSRIGSLYFAHPKGREISREYYKTLIELAKENKFDESIMAVRKYGIESGKLWVDLKDDVFKELSED